MYFTIKVYVCCGQGSKPSTSCNRLQGGYLKKVTKKLSIGGGKAGLGRESGDLPSLFTFSYHVCSALIALNLEDIVIQIPS